MQQDYAKIFTTIVRGWKTTREDFAGKELRREARRTTKPLRPHAPVSTFGPVVDNAEKSNKTLPVFSPRRHNPSDPTPSDYNPSDYNPSDPNPSDPNLSDYNPSDYNPSDPNPSDYNSSDPNPADPNPPTPTPPTTTPPTTTLRPQPPRL